VSPGDLLDLAHGALSVFGALFWAWLKENPLDAFIAFLAFVGLLGVVIDSGHRGVLYQLGRVKRVLEPGFHPLIPWIQQVRKVHIRSHTLDAPRQRATSADGFVYDLDCNVVYKIDDPVRSLIEIAVLTHGVQTVVSVAAQELVRARTRDALRAREDLDAALVESLTARLATWGVRLERAGFTSLAPTPETLRLTQLAARVREREVVLGHLLAAGLRRRTAIALLGADRRLVSHSHAAYRRPAPKRARPTVEPAKAAAAKAET
jgi:regulator of protease activity HflC (stomatin/prohibitin superfamily)